MADQAELQAKIAALRGQINQRKQHPPPHRGGHHFAPPHRPHGRWEPYGGVTSPRQPVHRNRQLVVGDGHRNGAVDKETVLAAAVPPPAIGKRPTPITTPQDASLTRPAKSTQTKSQPTRELVIEGLRFQVQPDGRKLIRVADSATSSKETPKKIKVADVDFLRTKHGNLVRAAIAKDTRRTRMPQCENFTKHGTCSFGPACRYTHDPTKVAVCKDFLHTGSCKAGRNCDLSHDATYHRAPACTHFLRGNCTNSACRYPHINISPAASVCRPFATLGFCSKGAECDKRHVFECPDYANHGHCANREKKACALPHIDRAATLRKAAERQAKTGSEDESDLSSDDDEEEEEAEKDIDSDVAEDIDMDDDSHQLSQQQDFIAFS